VVNMRPAEGAIQINTTDLAVEEVVTRIEQIVVAQHLS
jgi:cytidylate kinase